MFEGSFKIDDISFDINELKKENFYSIIGSPKSGKTTTLINLAISLCKKGSDVIYINVESTDSYIINKIKNKVSLDMEIMKKKFHYIHCSNNITLTEILDYIKTNFSNDILSGAIIIIDDLYFLKNDNNDKTLYNNMKHKVSQLKKFCDLNGIIPIVSVQSVNPLTVSNDSYSISEISENRMGIESQDTKYHSKVLIRKL